MTTLDYKGVSIPIGLIQKIDDFLETAEAKKMGVFSRAELIKILIRDFFEKYDSNKSKK